MILVLRALGLGDLATAVPALRGLRATFPERTIALAAPSWLEPLVDLVGGVDCVVPTEGLDRSGWRLPEPYWAVNLHGRGPESHLLLQRTRPRSLRAFASEEAGHDDGPTWSADEHEVERWCRLLDWYGVPTDRDDLALRRPGPDRVPVGITVLHPGAKNPYKRWSPARFAAVARRLNATGHRVVVTGSREERELAEFVARRGDLPPTAVLAGRIDLTELAALIAYGRLVVSADTGVAHLATAYGTPSVVLFGPVSPRHWGPPPDRPWHRALWTGSDAAGPLDPTAPVRVRDGMHPLLAAIGVDEVLGAAQEVQRAGRERGAAAA